MQGFWLFLVLVVFTVLAVSHVTGVSLPWQIIFEIMLNGMLNRAY